MLKQGGYNPNLMVGDQCYPAFELRNLLVFIQQELGDDLVQTICQQIGVGMVELAASQFVYVWQVDFALESLRTHSSHDMGAKLGASYQVESLDVLLPYLEQFDTLGDCLQFVVKHPELVGSFTDSLIRVEGNKLWVRWLNTGKSNIKKYSFQFQHSICSLIGLARQLAGKHIVVSDIHLADSQQNSDGVEHPFLAEFTGAKVCYQQAYFEWSIEINWLSLPITFAFPQQNSTDQRPHIPSLIEAVLQQLRRAMPEVPTSLEMAEMMHMSDRSLRRKLASAGSSYQKLVDQVRCQLAIKMILSDKMHAEDIADIMGYSDVSHFRQSFKHWLGYPPGYFLRQNLSEKSE
ncbi:helix-turn-helix domain-containing protein [Shewanella holmiensis]|uniref:AraC family transcriptional regulator n=1 Tax=Shewanella holmiensis TaxID=2952222 RepID=A0A9X3AVE3_9GAMM|nr:AraC family transcriptional regulator [Shewanella holmiensis]MCT7942545.1 AraC family transcriptional regulator [Shewanella holmiensis]